MTFGKSTTPVFFDAVLQSVDRVSGQKPCFVALHHLPIEVTVDAVAEVEDDAAAARRGHVRKQPTLLVENAIGRRRIHVRDDVAALEQRQNRAHRRIILADMNHHRQIEGGSRFLRATQALEIVRFGDVVRHAHLHADDDITVACDRAAREIDIR